MLASHELSGVASLHSIDGAAIVLHIVRSMIVKFFASAPGLSMGRTVELVTNEGEIQIGGDIDASSGRGVGILFNGIVTC